MGSLVEITESVSPLIIWRREYRENSGGAGKQRGGLGQTIELSSSEDSNISLFVAVDRVDHVARGREHGKEGAAGSLSLTSGKTLKSKGEQIIPAGEKLIVLTPGGGGYGNPLERKPSAVLNDVRSGLVDFENAEKQYGIIFDSNGDFRFTKARKIYSGSDQ